MPGSTRDVTIPLRDGVTLAATLYLPDPSSGPQPCVLEALPYRKDDLSAGSRPEYIRLRDEYAYAVCRLDLRGTGSSGGDAVDEYPQQERPDLQQVITWLAGQEWCDGAIGMYGTSYSGFNSLQLACERPPELKAVIAIYASDDRWTDDVHWRGGALRVVDLVDYCHYMTAMNALPPVPAVWGDTWREEWVRRVQASEPWLLTWLRERVDGPYWRSGSVAPAYDRITCPVMLVAGWADGYRNNTFRTVAALRAAGVPHRLLVGPWAHAATDTAIPGPRIDLVPEMVAWWDRWLRGRGGNGAIGERPAVSVFVRGSTRPEPDLADSNGRWVTEEWPCPRVRSQRRALDARAPYPVRADTGVDAWIDCAGHLPWGPSLDQRFDDAASLRWEWDGTGLALLGHPVVRLTVSADQPYASVTAKLCDVFPDETSALITRGSLDLRFRSSRNAPEPLQPGRAYEVELVLDACAYELAAGHVLRLSVAGTDWPNTAAPPGPVTLTVPCGELQLPVWSGDPPHAVPQLAAGDEENGEDPTGVVWRVERDVLRRETAALVDSGATYPVRHGGEASERYTGRVSVDTRTFEQRAEGEVSYQIRWPEVTVSTRSRLDLRIGAEGYSVSIDLEARENGVLAVSRSWRETLPR